MAEDKDWYVVKCEGGECEIVPTAAGEMPVLNATGLQPQWWGPFSSQQEAIARRVGLIRAHKCQPRTPGPILKPPPSQ